MCAALGTVFTMLSFASAAPSAREKAVRTLTALDHIEINELLARFNGTLNVGDAEGFASVFAPNGEFHIGVDTDSPQHIIGHDALIKFVQEYKLPLVQIRVFMNLIAKATPEGAIATCDQFAWFMDRNPASFISVGAYNDVLVRTGDGWRIKSRTLFRRSGPAKPGTFGKCEKCQ
jgi:hypothetical protein